MFKHLIAMAMLLVACGGQPHADTTPTPREAQLMQERDAALAREQVLQQQLAAEQQVTHARLDELTATIKRLTPTQAAANAKRYLDPDKTYAVQIGDVPVIGPATALVTMIRAYEYACPYCERSRATMERLQARYGKDLRIVYKPLLVHPKQATGGALAACAAHKQGKFAEMDKILWEQGYSPRRYDTSDACNDHGECPVATSFAKRLGLNLRRFKADMQGACVAQLRSEQALLKAFGVSGTPSFFINGRFLSGAQNDDVFIALIDEELAKARAAVQAGVAPEAYYAQEVLGKGEPASAAAGAIAKP